MFEDAAHLARKSGNRSSSQSIFAVKNFRPSQRAFTTEVPFQGHLLRIYNPVFGDGMLGIKLELVYPITSNIRGAGRQYFDHESRRPVQPVVYNNRVLLFSREKDEIGNDSTEIA